MSAKLYHGWRDKNGKVHVRADDKSLKARRDLFNHSPTGFEWGYNGSGPAQLALAILADALADDELAVSLHQLFKFEIIGKLARDEEWRLHSATVRAVATRLRAQKPQVAE